MSGALAGLQKPIIQAAAEPSEWPFALARLVVWDEESEEDDATIEVVPLKISVTQQSLLTHGGVAREDDPNWIGYYITGVDDGDVEIKPEWVGKSLYVELAPSLVKALDDDLEAAADKWDGTIA